MINTILTDLDDTLYDTGIVRTVLLQELKKTLENAYPHSPTLGDLCKTLYDILKVDGNYEKIVNGDFDYNIFNELPDGIEMNSDRFRGALFEFALAYHKFMNETLFLEENRERFFTSYAGVLESLEELVSERYIVGMISNGYSSAQRKKADSLGIVNYFDFIQVSDDHDVEARKPSMKFYDRALEKAKSIGEKRKLKVSEETTAIVEDRATCFPEKKNNYTLIKIGNKVEKVENPAQKKYKTLNNFVELPFFLLDLEIEAAANSCDRLALMRDTDIEMSSFNSPTPVPAISYYERVLEERKENWLRTMYWLGFRK